MKFKIMNLDWEAGKPSVILSRAAAEKLGVKLNDQVTLKYKSKRLNVAIDLSSKIVRGKTIGVSEEVKKILGTLQGEKILVSFSGPNQSSILIKKKINGKRLSRKEMNTIIKEIAENKLTVEETTYFVSSEKLNGLSRKELIYLIEAMVSTGERLKFNSKIVADKHCIGGVAGNRTTPIVVSICAAAGLTIPKNSSRAITSAAGTADVIETIAKVDFLPYQIKKIVNKTNACLVWGGGENMVSADSRIINIERVLNLDVEPQMMASIISKKLIAGSTRLIIDLPYGKGAKIHTLEEAKRIGRTFKRLGKHFGIKVLPVYTDGRLPIGQGIGPVMEMKDIMRVLQGELEPLDLREKSLYLSSELMKLCGIKNARRKAEEILNSGEALKKFKEIINAQNRVKDVDSRIKKLRTARFKKTLYATTSGKITELDNQKINSLCRVLGNPDSPRAGVYLHKKYERVDKGDALITLYAMSEGILTEGIKFYNKLKPFKII